MPCSRSQISDHWSQPTLNSVKILTDQSQTTYWKLADWQKSELKIWALSSLKFEEVKPTIPVSRSAPQLRSCNPAKKVWKLKLKFEISNLWTWEMMKTEWYKFGCLLFEKWTCDFKVGSWDLRSAEYWRLARSIYVYVELDWLQTSKSPHRRMYEAVSKSCLLISI